MKRRERIEERIQKKGGKIIANQSFYLRMAMAVRYTRMRWKGCLIYDVTTTTALVRCTFLLKAVDTIGNYSK